jgi:hypothetical protein
VTHLYIMYSTIPTPADRYSTRKEPRKPLMSVGEFTNDSKANLEDCSPCHQELSAALLNHPEGMHGMLETSLPQWEAENFMSCSPSWK